MTTNMINTYISNKDIYTDAILTFGVDNQNEMMIEECSEITKSIQKIKRLKDDVEKGRENINSIKFKNKKDQLEKEYILELVDVEIIINQLKNTVNKNFYEKSKSSKLKYLASLIKEEKTRKIREFKKNTKNNETSSINVDEVILKKIRDGKNKKIKRPNQIRNQMKKLYIKNKESETKTVKKK